MGKGREHRRRDARAGGGAHRQPTAYPPSPSSTSSSDFEFTVSLSPTSRRTGAANLCPADELFYKGQLLPLHLSPRISMVRSLLLASSSSSSCSDSVTTASRDSSGSSDSTVSAFSADGLALGGAGECDSSRPSSVAEEEGAGRVVVVPRHHHPHRHHHHKYYSLASLATRFSSVFHRKKDAQPQPEPQPQPQQQQEEHHVADAAARQAPQEMGNGNSDEPAATQGRISSSTSGRRAGTKSGTSASSASTSAKEVFKKYVRKVKPLYEKLDQKLSALQQHRSHQQQQQQKAAARQELRKKTFSFSVRRGDKSAMERIVMSASASRKERDLEVEEEEEEPRGSDGGAPIYAHASFSGNLRYLRRRQSADAVASCPSSMRSSPSHSGLLYPRQRGSGGAGGSRNINTPFVDASPASTAGFPACRFPLSSWSSSSSMEELQSAIQGAIAHCKSTMATQSTNLR